MRDLDLRHIENIICPALINVQIFFHLHFTLLSISGSVVLNQHE